MSKLYVDEIRPKSSGKQVIMPEKPSFYAYRTSHQTLTQSTWQALQADETKFNIGNCWDTTNHKFVAPVDGIYFFGANVIFTEATSSGGYTYLKWYMNGADYNLGPSLRIIGSAIQSDSGLSSTTMAQMDAGDEMQLYVYTDGTDSTPRVTGDTRRPSVFGYLVG